MIRLPGALIDKADLERLEFFEYAHNCRKSILFSPHLIFHNFSTEFSQLVLRFTLCYSPR
jgi:hypothetical protein